MERLISGNVFLLWKNIYFVFVTFSDNLFAFSHKFILTSSQFIARSTSLLSKFSPKLYNVVSSAYTIQLNFGHVLGKSFMYMLNNRDPKIEPCGTSIHIVSNFEFVFPNYTCCIFFGNDLMVAKRYEQIFFKYPTCIIYLPILLIFLGLLIWQLETVYNIIMCTHRWISISPEKWLI